MTNGLIETAARQEQPEDRRIYGISMGTVLNNVDLCGLGRVQVHLAGLGIEPWARVGGTDNGTFFMPQVGDEVAVMFRNGDICEPIVMGALWNGLDRPPALSPTDAVTKRIMRSLLGHKIEFDDATQGVTIQTNTQQQVTLDPSKIEVATTGGTARITLDPAGNVMIQAAQSITLKATTITIQADTTINVVSGASTTINGGPLCAIEGALVTLNEP